MLEIMFFKILGILSAVVFLIGDMPYLLDAIKAKIKPHRVTWGITALMNGIGFGNQLASGASNSLWLFGAATLMTGAIFLASLKNGVGGHTKSDIICLIICLLGVALWISFRAPLYSIIAALIIDVVPCGLPLPKPRKIPNLRPALPG